MRFLPYLFPAMWFAYLAYWWAMASNVKADERREATSSRWQRFLFMIVALVLLGIPRIRLSVLDSHSDCCLLHSCEFQSLKKRCERPVSRFQCSIRNLAITPLHLVIMESVMSRKTLSAKPSDWKDCGTISFTCSNMRSCPTSKRCNLRRSSRLLKTSWFSYGWTKLHNGAGLQAGEYSQASGYLQSHLDDLLTLPRRFPMPHGFHNLALL